jgi:signal peptidase I
MAATLMGRHKDVTCPSCGELFQVNASEEIEGPSSGTPVIGGTCVNCRLTSVGLDKETSYKGDRILVMKLLYDLAFLPGAGPPERWDVTVFKYPESPETNYIKRLVGLPGEELQIRGGDIRVRPPDQPAAPFLFARRPLVHQRSMEMPVWNDAHRPKAFADLKQWRRWQSKDDTAWAVDQGAVGTYRSAGGDGWHELRYQHLVPDPLQWSAIAAGSVPPHPPRASLVTDFYSYNTRVMGGRAEPYSWFQPHWVGDLTLSARVRADEAKGRVRFELVRGGVPYRCTIDLSTGTARMSRGEEALGPPAPTRLKGTGSHDVVFANVDGRLTLWVDGRTPFGEGVVHDDGSAPPAVPTAADLVPAVIAASGTSVTATRLVLTRDIHYTQNPAQSDYDPATLHREGDRFVKAAHRLNDYQNPLPPDLRTAWMLDVLADPSRFAALVPGNAKQFQIRPDHFLMLGDNSPSSHDSRRWGLRDQLRTDLDAPELPDDLAYQFGWDPEPRQSWEVPRNLLVGKAFFIYWPHAWPVWPKIRVPIGDGFYLPFRPSFERMKWIQ